VNWTTRRAAALAAAACLTAISATALNSRHHRSHPKSLHTRASHSAPSASKSASASAPSIDRASHGRESLDSGYSSQSATRGENIARTALAYRGVAYRFGGRSAQSGFDCSGLVQAVCAKWGIYLPRVAGAQFAHGVAVNPAELQPGDLVFFQGTYKRGLSHVGIFIGEGQFVHAAGRGKGVRISNLGDTYFQHHWAGARRFDLKQFPKAHDEVPVLASEVIVDKPGGLAEPRGRFFGPEDRLAGRPPLVELHEAESREPAPRLR